MVGFDEVSRENSGPLDLSRPFEKPGRNETVMGNPGTGIPFFPGGFEIYTLKLSENVRLVSHENILVRNVIHFFETTTSNSSTCLC